MARRWVERKNKETNTRLLRAYILAPLRRRCRNKTGCPSRKRHKPARDDDGRDRGRSNLGGGLVGGWDSWLGLSGGTRGHGGNCRRVVEEEDGASSVSILLASISKETRGSVPGVGLSVGGSVGMKRHFLWVASL